MTSGALSIGGPGRSAVGTAMTSNTSGVVGPVAPKPIEQFVPPNTRWYTAAHCGPFLSTSPLTTRLHWPPSLWAVTPRAARISNVVSESWLPICMTGSPVRV